MASMKILFRVGSTIEKCVISNLFEISLRKFEGAISSFNCISHNCCRYQDELCSCYHLEN